MNCKKCNTVNIETQYHIEKTGYCARCYKEFTPKEKQQIQVIRKAVNNGN